LLAQRMEVPVSQQVPEKTNPPARIALWDKNPCEKILPWEDKRGL